MNSLPLYNEEQLLNLENQINNWSENFVDNTYFMLLCNELHYYTIFRHTNIDNTDFATLGRGVTELLFETGRKIVSDENCEDHYEIWAKNDDGANVFLLFPYDIGVVTYGE